MRVGGGSPEPRSNGDRPLVSVVTATFNARRTIEACLASVAGQTLRGVEHVVVDGGSTDGTVDVLRAWQDRLASWRSEPDGGIYDAMNKGIAASRGEWLYFLGADDVLAAPDVFERCALRTHGSAAVVYGDVRYTGGHLFRSSAGPKLLVGNTVHHQGALYAARVFDGWRYDTSLRICADYDLNLRLQRAGERFERADVVLAECGDEGASNVRVREGVREINEVRRRYVRAPANAVLSAAMAAEIFVYRLLRSVRRATAR